MPSWRRFSVDKHGTVHVREVFKPHWHGKATPSPKGAISAAQAEKPTRRVSPSRAQRSARRAADRAQRERTAQVRLRTKGILEVLSRQWRGKRRDDVWAEWRRQQTPQSTLPPGVLAQSQPAAEAPATPAPAPPSTPAHPIGDHDMQDSRGAKRAEGETLHPQQQSTKPAKKIKPRTSPAAPDAAAVAQPPAAVSPTDNNNSAPTLLTAGYRYPVLLAALARSFPRGQTLDRGVNLPECETDGEFDLRVRELREIGHQLSGSTRKYSQDKLNATAGGKQFLEPEMMEMLKNYHLKSTK
eukprot:scaffold25634_cov53-Phaeocystis_antarctica.AAC.1